VTWFLTTFPLPFWLAVATYVAVAGTALWFGYQMGASRVPAPVTLDSRPSEAERLAYEAYDFARGYEAGAQDERERHRAARSAAGHKAAATRRNRVTGEERPAIITATNWDAPSTLTGDGPE
jgi:hypothetical protein